MHISLQVILLVVVLHTELIKHLEYELDVQSYFKQCIQVVKIHIAIPFTILPEIIAILSKLKLYFVTPL